MKSLTSLLLLISLTSCLGTKQPQRSDFVRDFNLVGSYCSLDQSDENNIYEAVPYYTFLENGEMHARFIFPPPGTYLLSYRTGTWEFNDHELEFRFTEICSCGGFEAYDDMDIITSPDQCDCEESLTGFFQGTAYFSDENIHLNCEFENQTCLPTTCSPQQLVFKPATFSTKHTF